MRKQTKPAKPLKTRMSFYTDSDIKDWLEAQAKANNRSASYIITDLVRKAKGE